MYSSSAVHAAYATSSRNIGTQKSNEYSVVQHITRRLRQAASTEKEDYSSFAKAIALNRKLWRAFGMDVAVPENPLPRDLKAQIFYLSEFVEIHSRKVLKGEEDIEALIEINEMIMDGLEAQGTEA